MGELIVAIMVACVLIIAYGALAGVASGLYHGLKARRRRG